MIAQLLTQNAWLNFAMVAQLFTISVFLIVLFNVFNKKNKNKLNKEKMIPLYEEFTHE